MKKAILFTVLSLLIFPLLPAASYAHVDPNKAKGKNSTTADFRNDCRPGREETDMEINNVRARLLVGGTLWTSGGNGRYIVPKPAPGSTTQPVSALYAGGVWLGGVQRSQVGGATTLKLACQDYPESFGYDFYPGPLSDPYSGGDGSTNAENCRNWDRFFKVYGDSILRAQQIFSQYQANGEFPPASLIPEDLKRWPALGNPYFNDYYDFELPDASQGLGNFHDFDSDGLYDPTKGDYPSIDIRGCGTDQFPDVMYFFIYNDAGNIHNRTEGTPIRMEVQVQAYAYETQDEVNNMTFYRYKLINRAPETIDSTFFSMWIDPDLGCPDDDYIGCDSTESLMVLYNEDDVDGISGCECAVGSELVATYCNNVPILGVDYFRGPLSEPRFNPDSNKYLRVDLGMTSFMYYNRGGSAAPACMLEPENPNEFYNLLNGYWRCGEPLLMGGSGYLSGGVHTKYAFPQDPTDPDGWSMCSANLDKLDRRTLQTTGPFTLLSGDINELIIGVVWLESADYPCPSFAPLLRADKTAQGLFDNCFDLLDGPNAPDMLPLELDREIIFTLVNQSDTTGSSNYQLNYRERDPTIESDTVEDPFYRFEGYRIFQLAHEDVAAIEENFTNTDLAREILSVDLKNGVTNIYNWQTTTNPADVNEFIYYPELKIQGLDNGIVHSFNVTNDAFASGDDTRLVNFKDYYFSVIAYGYNNWKDFSPYPIPSGQDSPYIVGRRNVKSYKVTPRKTAHLNLNAMYGEGLEVTRLDGDGVCNNFLMLSDQSREEILQNGSADEITWLPGMSPLRAKIYDPVNIKDGEYLLSFMNYEADPSLKSTHFVVTNVETGESDTSEMPIGVLSEELLYNAGISVNFNQETAPGLDPFNEKDNGFIGSSVEYADPFGPQWYTFFQEGSTPAVNFIKTDIVDQVDYNRDPYSIYSNQVNTGFYPYILAAYDTTGLNLSASGGVLYSPAWFDRSGGSRIKSQFQGLENLNNVDIVFTKNKDLWSKCVIVQASNYVFSDFIAEDNRSMSLLRRPSASKDADPNDPYKAADANDGTVGYGYFPGYAIDVETGKRLNIFFAENTFMDGDNLIQQGADPTFYNDSILTGNDRIWNPNVNNGVLPDNITAGCQHYIFVTSQEYDGCEAFHEVLLGAADNPIRYQQMYNAYRYITWTGFPRLNPNMELLSYADGLIPNDLTIRMRVVSPFHRETHTGANDGFNQYRIKVEGKTASPLSTNEEINTSLDLINVVPNPYYAGSSYERRSSNNIVKITNLPQQCTVSIYSLDGRFIRKFDRNVEGVQYRFDNAPIPNGLYPTSIEWDLKNDNGILVSSGVYYIHIVAPGLGERVIKWFGVNRTFDPSSLN